MHTQTAIVGMKYHPGAHDKLTSAPKGTEIALVREPGNLYDRNAVACKIDNMLIGYVPRDDAVGLAAHMDAGNATKAILGGYNDLHIEITKPEEDE